jgi:hypothetical protein
VAKIVFFMALVFAPLAAAAAFVITYAEYAKHFVDKRQVLKRSLKTALVTLVFFLIVPPLLLWLFLAR